MEKPKFVYVTYIRTTPEKLWTALTDPEFIRRYWKGTHQESTWKKGAPWRLVAPGGETADDGEVVESEPPRRLVLSWTHRLMPDAKGQSSRMSYDIEAQGELTKLTVTHEGEEPASKLISMVSGGWPLVLASLKTYLETGEALTWPAGGCGSGR